MKKALSFFSIAFGGILSASAQTTGQINGTTLLSLLALAQTIVTRLVPFAVGVAVIAFFWFLIKYIMQGGESAEAKSLSYKGMLYSILAIFVMVSIWGIIGVFGSMLGIGQGGSVPIPGVPVPTN